MYVRTLKSGRFIISLLLTFCLIPMFAIAADIYVDHDAGGSNNGTSWDDAYNYLQDAFDQPPSSGDVIHVAEGTYYPDEENIGTDHTDDNRNETFQMISNVNMLGGYEPTGSGPRTRNPSTYTSTLSGDLDQSPTDPQNNDAYHVVSGANSATIDGFTITSGYANGGGLSSNGGGIYNPNVNPTVISCTISDNVATQFGAGMQNQGGSANPTVTNCTFSNNTGSSQGGAMNNYQASPTVSRCTFTNNSAVGGAGMFNNTASSSPSVTNCVFSGNTTTNGGGMYNNNDATPTITHCTFSGNTASGPGDGIFSNSGTSNATITNSILWGSTDQIYDNGASATIATYSDIQGSSTFPGTGNINTDPLFVGGSDLHLGDYSPCIGAGTNAGVTVDRDGSTRPQPALSNPDMGAYENSLAVSLPVELTMFSAICENGKVVLSWITESEVDNLGFILEKKTGGTDWVPIASYQTCDDLKGQGNTSICTEYVFTDGDVEPDMTYSYRLSDVDTKGHVTVDDMISITLDKLPEVTELKPAFPNPFNPLTKIAYTLVEDADVTLTVVDLMGRTVQTIVEGQNQPAGSYSIHWNGKDQTGTIAVSGTYMLVLNAGEVIKTQKVLLLR